MNKLKLKLHLIIFRPFYKSLPPFFSEYTIIAAVKYLIKCYYLRGEIIADKDYIIKCREQQERWMMREMEDLEMRKINSAIGVDHNNKYFN